MEARIARIDRIDKPVLERRKMDLALNGWRGSNQVLEFVKVDKSFSHRMVLKKLNLMIRHGERVGLIGANGAGKSVFLRLVLGAANIAGTKHEYPTHGEIKLGPSVKIGYYAQEHETLDFNQTPLEVVRRFGNMSESNAVALLIRYLFTYQQATQKISTLSGGERSRLQLLLVVLSGANFLLLDEPTNNLDIASAEVLENALNDFNGTVLVISHDRYFLDRTVSRIFELENAVLTEYIGGYSDYVERKNRE
jgi:ATP-binding cassette subfamily F protein 3